MVSGVCFQRNIISCCFFSSDLMDGLCYAFPTYYLTFMECPSGGFVVVFMRMFGGTLDLTSDSWGVQPLLSR